MDVLFQSISNDVVKIILLLGLSFLVGLEREEEKQTRDKGYFFGGVRTFPLLAFIGFLLVTLSPDNMLLFAAGFLVIGLFLVVSYFVKVRREDYGLTSEMAGLVTYLIGGVIAKDMYWLAVAVGVLNLFLLQMKTSLEGFAKRIGGDEITTLVKFLLLSAVMLPVIPNQSFTAFHINPYKTWLIVVAVSSVSYASYWLQKLMKARKSILLSAFLGGLYSSTVTTVVLSKQAKGGRKARVFTGGLVIATAMMYFRIAVLLYIFNRAIFYQIGWFFLYLSCGAALFGYVYAHLGKKKKTSSGKEVTRKPTLVVDSRNPLEVKTAIIFAVLFILILVLTNVVITYFGSSGVFTLAAIMGVVDVDPFILGLTQTGGQTTPVAIAAGAVVIASASNNIAKGVYAIIFGGKKVGVKTLIFLVLASLISLLSLV